MRDMAEPPPRRIRPGDVLPEVGVAEVASGRLIAGTAPGLFGRGRVLLVGVAAAFSPVCSEVHVPPLVRLLPDLRRAGLDDVYVIAADSPWVVDLWADRQDPERVLRWVSDGNLAFARALGLSLEMHDLFLGERIRRFVMIVRHGVVESLHVEPANTDVTCTAASALLADAA